MNLSPDKQKQLIAALEAAYLRLLRIDQPIGFLEVLIKDALSQVPPEK